MTMIKKHDTNQQVIAFPMNQGSASLRALEHFNLLDL